jgi:aryl-alcohol dehydrogenase-like predicted oxidoreductase
MEVTSVYVEVTSGYYTEVHQPMRGHLPMPLTSYITLGHSGLRVSPFCLGAMTFGEDWGWGASVADSEAMLSRFIDRGGNFIDTANIYTRGHSEKIIGDALGHDRARRDRLVIATKFCTSMYPGDPNGGGASAKTIIESCEQSLRRLRTDYIDLYWMHIWDRFTPIEETMRALDQLVQAGKIRYIGFSDTPAWKTAQAQTIAKFRGWAPLIALQIQYSLLERTVEDELMPMAQELGLGVTPWSPLRNGILSGKYTRANAGNSETGRAALRGVPLGEREYTLIDTLAEIARTHETSIVAIALAWVQGRAGVTSTIIGVRTLDQLDDNLKALDVVLSADDVAKLDARSQPPVTFTSINEAMARPGIQNGLTVNGITAPIFAMAPQSAAERY